MEKIRKANKGQRTLMLLLVAALLATAGAVAASKASNALAGGSTCTQSTCTWNGNGSDAASCQGVGPGTPILWIFTGDATPTDLVVTWSTGETDSITGWQQMGNGSWHLTTALVGTFPPKSAYVDFTGSLGNGGATLTISGCNESGGGGTTTTGTTETTTTGSTTTVTTPGGTTTVTTPGGTTTVTTPGATTTVTTPGQTTTVTKTTIKTKTKVVKQKPPKKSVPTDTR